MRRPLWGLVLWLATAPRARFAIDFGRYHSGKTKSTPIYMKSPRSIPTLAARPHARLLASAAAEIDYLVLAKGDPDALPAIYLNGTHHGDEKSSTETVLGLIDFLVRNRQSGDVAEILDRYAIYLQPLVNPDGHALNSVYDAVGHDPNRDYMPSPSAATTSHFKIPSIKLVKELTDKVRFRAAVAFHSWRWWRAVGVGLLGSSRGGVLMRYLLHDLESSLRVPALGMPRYIQSCGGLPVARRIHQGLQYPACVAHGMPALTTWRCRADLQRLPARPRCRARRPARRRWRHDLPLVGDGARPQRVAHRTSDGRQPEGAAAPDPAQPRAGACAAGELSRARGAGST